MPLIYATPADLQDWSGAEPPENATALLRTASGLVRRASAGAVYATDADGYPTDLGKRSAMRDATCEHAAILAAHGIDPAAGLSQLPQQVQSKGADGRSVTYVADDRRAALVRLAEGRDLADTARQILADAGLISTRVVALGGGW